MFNPKYRILITSKNFPVDGIIGLGNQLVSIISAIGKHLTPHQWYGADIEAVGKGARKHGLNSIKLSKIGTDLQFIEYCSEIDQFIWGVFLCIDENFSSQNIQNIELETEDKPYRSIDANGVLIEIRAFDTTYFGIYSECNELIEEIAKIYNTKIEKSES